MTANEYGALAGLQKSIDALNHRVERMNERVENVSKDVHAVKLSVAVMTGQVSGGWRVLAVLGLIIAVLGGWVVALRAHLP